MPLAGDLDLGYPMILKPRLDKGQQNIKKVTKKVMIKKVKKVYICQCVYPSNINTAVYLSYQMALLAPQAFTLRRFAYAAQVQNSSTQLDSKYVSFE